MDEIDHEELRRSFRDVLDTQASSARVHAHYDGEAPYDAALAQTVGELGWSALAVPEEHGGLGVGLRGLAILYEELGRGPAPLPALQTQLVLQAIIQNGTDGQRDKWVPRLAGGEMFAAWAPDANESTLMGGHLSGGAGPVVDGAAAGLFLLTLSDGSSVLVPADAPGVTVTCLPAVDRTRSFALVSCSDAACEPIAADVGALQQHAAYGVACDCLGGADAILGRTVEYLKTRSQFGKPIGSFQALKHRVASHSIRLRSLAAMIAEALSMHQDRARGAAMASLAQAEAVDVYAAIAADAVQLHGGIGFTWEQDSHLFLKRAKLNQMLFGGPEAALDAAAGKLLETAA